MGPWHYYTANTPGFTAIKRSWWNGGADLAWNSSIGRYREILLLPNLTTNLININFISEKDVIAKLCKLLLVARYWKCNTEIAKCLQLCVGYLAIYLEHS